MRFAKPSMIPLATMVAVCWTAIGLVAQEDSKPSVPIFLTGGTIHTLDGKDPFVGSILIVDGKIQSIGADLKPPADANLFSIEGCQVTPGLIESRGKLWLTENAISEADTKASLNVADAIDPWSEDWQELASQGITSVYVQPASSGTLGGYGAVVNVGPFQSIDTIILKDKSAVQASLGTKGSTSKDRFAQVEALEKLLESAKQEIDKEAKEAKDKEAKEKEAKSKTDAKGAESKDESVPTETNRRGRRRGPESPATSAQDPEDDDKAEDDSEEDKPRETDTAKSAIKQVLKKELPLHLEVHHSDTLQHALRLAKKYDFRLVLDGLARIHAGADLLADSRQPMVIGPLLEMGTPPDYRKDATRSWLKPAVSHPGQLWAISGFPNKGLESRLLRAQAATAVEQGISNEQVLAALTVLPARMLGVVDQVGTLETGKHADIAVFAGDPLDPATAVRLAISNGQVIFDNPDAKVSVLPRRAPRDLAWPDKLPARYIIKSSQVLRGGELAPAALLIEDGVIRSIEDSLATEDVAVFDLGDAVVTPGLVNAHSTLGQSATITDATESDSSHLRATDGLDPVNQQAKEMLHGGFIHVAVNPGNANTSSGLTGHVRLGSATFVANPALASQFVLSSDARKRDRFPATISGQLTLLNQLFAGQPAKTELYLSDSLAKLILDQKRENIQAAVEGLRPAIIVAGSDIEIQTAANFAKVHKLKSVLRLTGSGRVGKSMSAIADANMAVIIEELTGGEYDVQVGEYAALANSVPFAFGGESPEKIRLTAAMLASAGVDRVSVMQALTGKGGAVAGMSETGLSAGAPADLVIWDGHPLDLRSTTLKVVVDGQDATK